MKSPCVGQRARESDACRVGLPLPTSAKARAPRPGAAPCFAAEWRGCANASGSFTRNSPRLP
eukprot:8712542-Pyramimonas_sp.AAC.1